MKENRSVPSASFPSAGPLGSGGASSRPAQAMGSSLPDRVKPAPSSSDGAKVTEGDRTSHASSTDTTGSDDTISAATPVGKNDIVRSRSDPPRNAPEAEKMICLRLRMTSFFDQTSSRAELPTPLAHQSRAGNARSPAGGRTATAQPKGQHRSDVKRSSSSPLRDAKNRANNPNAT